MDIINGEQRQVQEDADEVCTSYIYSDEYMAYLVRYDRDIRGVYQIIDPVCVDVINSKFLVAYKEAPAIEDLEQFFQYGYGSLPKCYGLMDMSVVESVGGNKVRNLPGLALDGKGVLIGFVDTGIDFANPVFQDAQGNSRIEFLWDQNEEAMSYGTPVFGYGGEFSREDINRAIASGAPYQEIPSRDTVGHGTFMASVAAGKAIRTDENNFSGIAPEASIAMVKLKPARRILREFYMIGQDENCYSEDDIVQGIRYLISKAVQLARPLVVCLGVGTNQGDHNGNSNLEQYMEALSGLRGICFVSSGGNELGGRHHFAGSRVGNVTGVDENSLATNQEIMEINVETGNPGFSMELWGNAPGLLKVDIESPSGESLDNVIPNESGTYRGEFLYEGTSVFVENIVVEGVSGDQVIFIRFEKPGPGIWRINVSEAVNQLGGGFDAWLPIDEFIGNSAIFVRPSPDTTITSPGNGRGSITATAYNHLNNAMLVNASRGYTRKGSIKPDIAAPGVEVLGVFAGGTDTTLFTRRSGTSVAASVLAGCSALILQWGIVNRNNLGINTEIIKQMIIRGAKRNEELRYPNNIWGWGTLDVFGVFETMRQ